MTKAITPSLPSTSYRIEPIDLLRGVVMVIMALDHTRDFFHRDAMVQDPLNLATTTPLLFLTRWITHFCAPVFVFLAGTSAWFQSQRKTKKELSGFLIKRGLWLVLMELTLVNFAFSFDVHFTTIFLQVIWAIGISMIILGAMIWLPFGVIVGTGLLIVLAHNALGLYESDTNGTSIFYHILHRPGFKQVDGHNLLILYPFLPWTGLMLLGYGFGRLFTRYEGGERKRILTWLGLGIIAFFIGLRATNLYGDGQLWSVQKNALFTVFSFVNTSKYPPSLLFLCMTIGPAILFLARAGAVRTGLAKAITVYGRVPFLYFVVHFYLIHFLSAVYFLDRGHSFAEGLQTVPGTFFKFTAPGEGYSLLFVYQMWMTVVVLMYPVCKWFSNYKRTHRQWWLSYL